MHSQDALVDLKVRSGVQYWALCFREVLRRAVFLLDDYDFHRFVPVGSVEFRSIWQRSSLKVAHGFV